MQPGQGSEKGLNYQTVIVIIDSTREPKSWVKASRRRECINKVTSAQPERGRRFLRFVSKTTSEITPQSIITNWNKSGHVTIFTSSFLIVRQLARPPSAPLFNLLCPSLEDKTACFSVRPGWIRSGCSGFCLCGTDYFLYFGISASSSTRSIATFWPVSFKRSKLSRSRSLPGCSSSSMVSSQSRVLSIYLLLQFVAIEILSITLPGISVNPNSYF